MTHYAADDFLTIKTRLKEIENEKLPKCPNTPTRTLYDCLRSSARCGDNCPHQKDWIGPENVPIY